MVQGAVGAEAGTAELLINRRNPTLSTLSAEWAATVSASPRFPGERWDERVAVEVTTLDALIAVHGVPRFCKIDVEGFEESVLGEARHLLFDVWCGRDDLVKWLEGRGAEEGSGDIYARHVPFRSF